MNLNTNFSRKQVLVIEFIFIAIFSFSPLFIDLPYRVNIFVTWEGAYRMFSGQIPFRDFGMPLGYGFWLIPYVFFKIFGPYVFTLVIAQCFVNLASIFAFRGILKLFNLNSVQVLLSVLTFCLSFVLINFWPWYNHTVFVYELVGIYFLIHYILKSRRWIFLALSALFIALCFFTKQDAGGLSLILSLALLFANWLSERKTKPIFLFILFYCVIVAMLILPLLQYDFLYWFNYGQAPHFSRINAYDFISAFFEESLWIKFYLVGLVIICIVRFEDFKSIVVDKTTFLFTVFTFGILVQAMIIQVTSFSPPTTNYYFHSFAIAFLLFNLKAVVTFEKRWITLLMIMAIFLWRSENYWKYSMRLISKFVPSAFSPPPPSVVSKNTWSSKSDSVKIKSVEWSLSNHKVFNKIKLPTETIEGIERIKSLNVVKASKDLQCLNLTNLTPLAYELNYKPSRGQDFPLWYHQGVASFDREVDLLCGKIAKSEFDLVLFEVMPNVDNFFPFAVRECLNSNYKLVDSFISPTGYQTDFIEVYVKKE